MAYRVYILIRLKSRQERAALQAVREAALAIREVEFVDAVVGPYDLVAVVESTSPDTTAAAIGQLPQVDTVALCRVVDVSADPGHPAQILAQAEGRQ